MPDDSSSGIASRSCSGAILLVHDDQEARTAVTMLLEQAGHFVIPAFNSEEALTIWDALNPSFKLVIIDLDDTPMSGHILAEQLAERGATIPVLVVASPACDQPIQSTFTSPLINVIAKPFDPDTLLVGIRALLTTAIGV